MKVYKFGGASVKDALSIKNVLNVLKETKFEKGIIVVSAMGKTTNALEILVENYQNQSGVSESIQSLKEGHYSILDELFPQYHPVYDEVTHLFSQLESFLTYNKSKEYNFIYDQIVPYGELISTTIISQYLKYSNMSNEWIDSRQYIKTDQTYREGQVNWELTQQYIQSLNPELLYVTQGFIASDNNNFSVTLGREGSDFSAAIFAYATDAESMTIWKDVPGVLNADPRSFEEAQLLEQISYQEAVEMAFYGASVIHPKTLKPLENKNIPFYVKSFLHPNDSGTKITKGAPIVPHIPCFIKKGNQQLLQISPRDFSFVSEYHMSEIFECLSKFHIKISMIQISAISLNLCLEDKYIHLSRFLTEIENKFETQLEADVCLYTIRHFDESSKALLIKDKELLLEQIVAENLQIVTR